MIVHKVVEAKANSDQKKFVLAVQKIITDLEQNGAKVVLAIWGRKISQDSKQHNRLFAEIYFSAEARFVRLVRGDNEVMSVNAVALGQCRTRNVIGMLAGTQRGDIVQPLPVPVARHTRIAQIRRGL